MRFPLLCAIVLILPACGGGGGGGVPPGGTPPGATDLRTQEILQDCLPLALVEATDWAQRLQDVFDGNGSSQGFSILPGGVLPEPEIDPTSLTIQWFYDPDGGRIDGTGSFRFEDDAGLPTQPFSQTDLDALTTSEHIDTLGTILPNVAEGAHLVAAYTATDSALQAATVDVTFTAGAPGVTDGVLGISDADCGVQLDWSGVPLANLLGDLATTFPSGAWDVSLGAGADIVTGTLTMDGSRTATASVSRNGEATTNWQLDLVTGVATQV